MTARRFWISTFGCQMNEHDSERLAGLFSEQGMEPVGSADEADLVVFNTCCVRENADNKFYGHLGDLKALKRRRPDLQIAVGGCLAQKDRELILERAGHVDVVFGTHNLAHAVDLLDRSRLEGPVMEILEESEAFPSALPARRDVDHAAWVTIQIGCDNTCAFCIVPAVRGKEQSRRLGDIVREVEDLAADGVTEQDAHVAGYVLERGRAAFVDRFWFDAGGYLSDVVEEAGPDDDGLGQDEHRPRRGLVTRELAEGPRLPPGGGQEPGGQRVVEEAVRPLRLAGSHPGHAEGRHAHAVGEVRSGSGAVRHGAGG